MPGLQVVAVEGVVEAEHAHAVLNAGEPFRRSSAHPLGGAVGPLQVWMVLFQLEQLAIEAVVDRVLHHWSIENVIGVAGTVEQLPQFRGPLVRISH